MRDGRETLGGTEMTEPNHKLQELFVEFDDVLELCEEPENYD